MCLNGQNAYPIYILAVFDPVFSEFCEKSGLGQLTDRPTLRWIFQCFQAIHLLQIDGVEQVSNLTDERLRILHFFPATCQGYYLLSNPLKQP
jgi:hypothetical protein